MTAPREQSMQPAAQQNASRAYSMLRNRAYTGSLQRNTPRTEKRAYLEGGGFVMQLVGGVDEEALWWEEREPPGLQPGRDVSGGNSDLEAPVATCRVKRSTHSWTWKRTQQGAVREEQTARLSKRPWRPNIAFQNNRLGEWKAAHQLGRDVGGAELEVVKEAFAKLVVVLVPRLVEAVVAHDVLVVLGRRLHAL